MLVPGDATVRVANETVHLVFTLIISIEIHFSSCLSLIVLCPNADGV